MATWAYGYHSLPAGATLSGNEKIFRPSYKDLPWTLAAENELKPAVKLPVVLYLHGCRGIGAEDEHYRKFLLSLGYGVFMPDSFKCPGRLRCGNEGSLADRVRLRLKEIDYALSKIRELPWVDNKRLILMGWSEGGNSVDNWARKGFSAHIIMASACTLMAARAPAAAQGIPVLAITGTNDEYRPGMSCEIKRTVGGSKSVIIAGAGHRLANNTRAQAAIKLFLNQCCT